ncbi:DNA-binding NarL/FixJ family response regulator [Streptosporangium album]|uniref:DNA-binding NarL/FixJ family response regulator n=1 Tax=Streptosporangium album TaxID=47479 RepID=A0A7W7S4S0_9ACTN|nr:response regulator transcription factor [Streptosporangium album]MBB4943492.1 DNA-binding NarL/FixJ family response regulator [Streptosporangium album]
MTIRVLLADDQAMIRASLRIILEDQPDISVVAEASDGAEAVALARRLRPDVCLVDIQMPRLDGVEVTRVLAGPGVPDPLRVIVVTTFDLDEYVCGTLRGGAVGFVLKDAGPVLLVEAVRAIARGRTNQEIADELFISLSTVKGHIPGIQAKLGVRNRVEIAGWAWENRIVGTA